MLVCFCLRIFFMAIVGEYFISSWILHLKQSCVLLKFGNLYMRTIGVEHSSAAFWYLKARSITGSLAAVSPAVRTSSGCGHFNEVSGIKTTLSKRIA